MELSKKRKKYWKTFNQFSSTTNIAETIDVAGRLRKKQKQQDSTKNKDLSQVIYYNYNKKGHYINKYPETLKNKS